MSGLRGHKKPLEKIACYWFCTKQTQEEKKQPESFSKKHGERQEKLLRIFRKVSGSSSNSGLTQRRIAKKKFIIHHYIRFWFCKIYA